MNGIPVEIVARRLADNLATTDRLLRLLYEVHAGHLLTNLRGEAICAIPEDVMAEIVSILGPPLHTANPEDPT